MMMPISSKDLERPTATPRPSPQTCLTNSHLEAIQLQSPLPHPTPKPKLNTPPSLSSQESKAYKNPTSTSPKAGLDAQLSTLQV